MVEDGGGSRPIDLLDDGKQQLSNHELAGPKPGQTGGAPRSGEGAGHLRELGFASPRGRIQHPVCGGHDQKVRARGAGESPFFPAPRRFLGELGFEPEQPPPRHHRTQEQHGQHL